MQIYWTPYSLFPNYQTYNDNPVKVFIIIYEPFIKKGTLTSCPLFGKWPYAQITGPYVENNTYENVHFRVSMKHNVKDISKDELNA